MTRVTALQRFVSGACLLVVAACLSACEGGGDRAAVTESRPGAVAPTEDTGEPTGVVTLAFAGDVHFQLHLAGLLDGPVDALGSITGTLADADLTMVNLESAITERGIPEPKERENPEDRYWYRTSPAALDLLAAAGVDVVTLANNHGADYGPIGVADTLASIRSSPIPVIGIGRDRKAAFTPYRVSVRGTDFAFFAADRTPREGTSPVWAAAESTPGIAAARAARPRVLLAAVRAASARDDVVVVYLHWGAEYRPCPTARQRVAARALADAGADIVVGSHAHVQLGSGWAGETYVNYGLGNFLWYHNNEPETGVLRLSIKDGEIVDDHWVPARIRTFGRPLPLRGHARTGAVAEWRRLRGCAGLASRPSGPVPAARYVASVRRIGPELRASMHASHGDRCPVPWRDLRYLRMSHVGFDGRDHIGEMVVAARYARAVTGVFERLYDARWPIRRMRLVDVYDGDDNRSMAANNTSAYNCRRVAGGPGWSAHAYGTAIDINPVQNPYLVPPSIAPPAGRRFAAIDRSGGSPVPTGAIRADDVVVRAFSAIGWQWGGTWATSPDYQHFAARRTTRR